MMHGDGQETVTQLPKPATEYSTLCCRYRHPSYILGLILNIYYPFYILCNSVARHCIEAARRGGKWGKCGKTVNSFVAL